ncbi:hypothetical protein H9P43_003285 [Blastocladiella emersonii ATCC 22665]|nr:hypothetical protein H9P43_003282 [Blastocladiella emersonii ATCC 22665]KAI9184232.1 hypothetical protein H9P43_003285 [Blastocladiella emersonii ATCC 22665]
MYRFHPVHQFVAQLGQCGSLVPANREKSVHDLLQFEFRLVVGDCVTKVKRRRPSWRSAKIVRLIDRVRPIALYHPAEIGEDDASTPSPQHHARGNRRLAVVAVDHFAASPEMPMAGMLVPFDVRASEQATLGFDMAARHADSTIETNRQDRIREAEVLAEHPDDPSHKLFYPPSDGA